LNNGFVSYDDEDYLTKNANVQSGFSVANIKWAFTAVVSSNWHPLTLLSHALDWSLFKDHAGGHHLISLLLHIGNVLLLFLFLNKATGNLWPSAFAAAIFALHPLRVESVAWASERKDVLSLFFGLAAIYVYGFYANKPQFGKYILCLILFALGLMAKPMLVTLPIILMLLDYWPLKRWQKALKSEKYVSGKPANPMPLKIKGKKQKSAASEVKRKVFLSSGSSSPNAGYLILEKVPFIVLAIASSIITVWAQYKGISSFQKLPLFERMANALVSYISYLGKTFWPVDLAVFYPYQHAYASWQILGSFFILLGISIAVIYFVKKAPFLLVGWLWYLGTLVPVIGLVQVGGQAMADRYTYLPTIGIVIMAVWGIAYLLPPQKICKIILIPTAFVVLAILSFLTWQQCGYWKNSIVLYEHALQITKNNDLAHYNLGDALKDQGNMEEALKHFLEAVKINPNSADAHNNIGIILELHFKKYDEAIYHYHRALRIDSNNPGTHFNLGIALAAKGERQEAIKHFQQAIYLKPDYEAARKWLRLTMETEQKQTKR
jgi:tetratricopeptide (TPR) repeat protein